MGLILKNAVSSIEYGKEKEFEMQILFNDDVVDINSISNKATIQVNGKTHDSVVIQTGKIDSKEMTDATVLQFSYIGPGGQLTTVGGLTGETFEISIPWEILKNKVSDKSPKAMISISSGDSKIQVPFNASPKSNENWLQMRITK
uniref:hypothetical protein n=1 Tax=Mariniflexile sp. TaxID=1979402 RepID=UPI00404825D8